MCFSFIVRKKLFTATLLPLLDCSDVLYMHATAQVLHMFDKAYYSFPGSIKKLYALTHHVGCLILYTHIHAGLGLSRPVFVIIPEMFYRRVRPLRSFWTEKAVTTKMVHILPVRPTQPVACFVYSQTGKSLSPLRCCPAAESHDSDGSFTLQQ